MRSPCRSLAPLLASLLAAASVTGCKRDVGGAELSTYCDSAEAIRNDIQAARALARSLSESPDALTHANIRAVCGKRATEVNKRLRQHISWLQERAGPAPKDTSKDPHQEMAKAVVGTGYLLIGRLSAACQKAWNAMSVDEFRAHARDYFMDTLGSAKFMNASISPEVATEVRSLAVEAFLLADRDLLGSDAIVAAQLSCLFVPKGKSADAARDPAQTARTETKDSGATAAPASGGGTRAFHDSMRMSGGGVR